MRAALLLLPVFIFQNLLAAPVPKPSKEKAPEPPKYTQLLAHLSNPAIEALFQPADALTSQPDLGNCEHFIYRVKMSLPQDLQMDAALNEFMSMISPAERTFNFAVLTPSTPGTGILKMARGDVSEGTQNQLNSLNEEVGQLLNSNPNAVMVGGIAVYSKSDKSDNEMIIRAIVDSEANEFLMFGAGLCK